jgi:ubiquinone/menaquinone biosynthesis C-methylase UbiE
MTAVERNNTMTDRFLADAGVAADMRVVELGCGGGEVTLLLAERVGPTGRVLAVDRHAPALAQAQARLRQAGFANVEFLSADLAGPDDAVAALARESFDVIAGRRVLMYLPDPVATLRRFMHALQSNAIAVFEEVDLTMVPARVAALPAHDRGTRWLRQMLAAEGANPAMGFALPSTLVQAGFRFERVRAEAVIQGQGTQFPLATLLGLVRARIVATGVATDADIDAIGRELAAETADATALYVSEMAFCAWGVEP